MTAFTRELERTRNGAKIMERTLEAAKVDIDRLREDYADSQDRIKALEDALRPFAAETRDGYDKDDPDGANFMSDIATIGDLRRAAALLEKK